MVCSALASLAEGGAATGVSAGAAAPALVPPAAGHAECHARLALRAGAHDSKTGAPLGILR